MLALDLPEDIENRLDILSLGSGHTRQYYVMEALLEYLHEVEERHGRLEQLSDSRKINLSESVSSLSGALGRQD